MIPGAHGIAVYGTSTDPTEDILVTENELSDLVLGYSEVLVVNGNTKAAKVPSAYGLSALLEANDPYADSDED